MNANTSARWFAGKAWLDSSMKEVALVSSVPMQADSARGGSNTTRTFAGIPKCNLFLRVRRPAGGSIRSANERKRANSRALHKRHRPAATGQSLAGRLSADDAVGGDVERAAYSKSEISRA